MWPFLLNYKSISLQLLVEGKIFCLFESTTWAVGFLFLPKIVLFFFFGKKKTPHVRMIKDLSTHICVLSSLLYPYILIHAFNFLGPIIHEVLYL